MIKYALTKYPTPIFNTSEIAACFGGLDGNSLQLDDKGLMRCIETVLFPESKVELLEQVQSPIWQVRTQEYPYAGPFYIDERFVRTMTEEPNCRRLEVPPKNTILQKLHEMEYCRYIWGGNWPKGIEMLPQLYSSKTPLAQLDNSTQDIWKLKGLDCSGLPYYITNGWTPRNTSALVHFGKPVPIEGKNTQSIIDQIESLDFIVWTGHVVWVINRDLCIESRHPFGLVRTKLSDRLSEIMNERKPVDDWDKKEGNRFVIRRWHPDQINV
jgi:hypothetical protein